MIRPEPGFVAHAPHDDAGVVLVAFDHAYAAGKKLLRPPGVFAEQGIVMVSFKIGLIDHIQAEFIAEFIESAVVGIVAGPHRVDIVLLHRQQIPPQVCFRQDFTCQV